ncbi:MAG: hypothetical protein CMM96_00360 [Rickettsiales bacterium]|nr:hypothetical protein [Rickettsiales bacterium]|tara:strand:- start:2012 stop:2512 length:501 start_codon:yes stop_codon:yes gene_type:complete
MNDKEIIIRETLDEDISGLFKILNDKENQKLVAGSMKSKSLQEVGDWLQDKRADHQTVIFSILKGEEFVGYIVITSIDLVNGHAILGINILRSFQGRGLGKIAVTQVHNFCKEKLSIRKLVLNVRNDNYFAISLYTKLGYKTVGTLSNHIKDKDNYVDNNIMEIFL